jgi:hypothetical protein
LKRSSEQEVVSSRLLQLMLMAKVQFSLQREMML